MRAMPNPTYTEHAVRRILERHLPMDVVSNVAKHGVTVQRNQNVVMKRGEWGDKPIHVVVDPHHNSIVTVYVANEWESGVWVRHVRRHRDPLGTQNASVGGSC
ncbi:DUF4258 domain-containing protein [Alicyclobacillus sp. SP_1]|jgi:hypothetical protein|uniref:DUF4258 domain-containing protein n=1 Tax=Alicyclobacillus sp. SP_1 TaxID=2942475 RepID=UPI002157A367|nr:DUF4258 domain-containing protein [Alicyclobacillus sp. SP_1]